MIRDWSYSRIRWSLRKVSLPIQPTDLVLEVGSGSNPHPASDVLLEKYVDNSHRYDPLVADRPTVLADACRMPFRDKAFDYVVAFHVLEHMRDPAAFLNELQRVAKAGYIETPNVLFERLVPYDVHLLEVIEVDGVLTIRKKPSARPDRFLDAARITETDRAWGRLFRGNPALFHVRHHWRGSIDFDVVNPDVPSDWFEGPKVIPGTADGAVASRAKGGGLRAAGLVALRRWHRWRKTRKIDVDALLACPECRGALAREAGRLDCRACGVGYPAVPLPDFNRPERL